MPTTSISNEQRVLQIISFTILNDSTIEHRFSQEGRRWRKAMRTIRKQTGWLRTLWGRDMNSSHKIDIFIAWTDIQAAESFQTSPSFDAVLDGINISPLTVHCITTHSNLSPHGLTELVTLFFPTALTHEDQEFFEEQLQHYTARLPHDEIRSTAHGWTAGPVGRGADSARGCLIFFEWGSLDQMFEVKRNIDSLSLHANLKSAQEKNRQDGKTPPPELKKDMRWHNDFLHPTAQSANASALQVLAIDLLNPTPAAESRKHKLKTLVPGPRSFFMDVKCPGCFTITTVFSHAQTVVICGGCSTVLCQPTGGKARLTEGCSFRRK
ncbi:MAG: 40S ribosomal protein S27 [Alectoria sarmentosa]|nr:MAG: 40S ribosomal protein S27 [Alectoria sarmentosa]